MVGDELINRHIFCFNEDDNGGEALTLTTDTYHNDDGMYCVQSLTLSSYCNSATFDLMGVKITPELLRKLADELEEAEYETNVLLLD